ncbi:MAG: Rne/Rng family ribonuclease [Candidatus Makana argininalis]
MSNIIMIKMLISTTKNKEIIIAVIDGQHICELDIYIENKKQKKNNIYKGIISKIEPSLNAVFVDYGEKRHGFLQNKKIYNKYYNKKYNLNREIDINKNIYKGQEIIVQIYKEENENKCAKLTTFITLCGNYLILMPYNPKIIGISHKISRKERDKIKSKIANINLPNSMGIIVRTSGIGISSIDFKYDLDFITKNWKSIKNTYNNVKSPFLIYKENNIINNYFRNYLKYDIKEVILDNNKLLNFLKKNSLFFKKKINNANIKFFNNKKHIFNYYQIANQIESIFKRKIKLPSGGSIIIENNESLTTIDVNSFKSKNGLDIEETSFNTNIEASYEIFRQIKFRNINGLIIIDFINMKNYENKNILEMFFKKLFKNDNAKINFSKISNFYILELSRQKLSKSINIFKYKTCNKCGGYGIIRNKYIY